MKYIHFTPLKMQQGSWEGRFQLLSRVRVTYRTGTIKILYFFVECRFDFPPLMQIGELDLLNLNLRAGRAPRAEGGALNERYWHYELTKQLRRGLRSLRRLVLPALRTPGLVMYGKRRRRFRTVQQLEWLPWGIDP